MAENEEVDDNSGDVEVDEALLSSDDPVTEGAEGQQEGDGEEESGLSWRESSAESTSDEGLDDSPQQEDEVERDSKE